LSDAGIQTERMAILENLTEIRTQLGLTRAAMARNAGIASSTLTRAENLESISEATIEKIGDALEQFGGAEYRQRLKVRCGPEEPISGNYKNIEIKMANTRELYTQSNFNMRAFMTLKFRHFATFTVVLALMTAGAYRTEGLSALRGYVLIFASLVTLAFWLLDRRTGEYLSAYARRAALFEGELVRCAITGDHTRYVVRRRLLSSTAITNIIFIMIFIAWLSLTAFEFRNTIADVLEDLKVFFCNIVENY
jgi:transcriptional regulator with XRE-family HTH domain